MRGWLRRARTTALLPAIGANMAGQLAIGVAQLAVVPAFATRWGAERYGVWLLLFTVPSYLAMADLGLASAAGNDMLARVARGERAAAAAIYRAVRAAIAMIGGAILLAGLLLVGTITPHLPAGVTAATGNHSRAVLLMMTGYGVLGLGNGAASAGLRATGDYARAGYLAAGGLMAEALVALALLAGGGGMATVAAGYLGARGVTTLLLARALARRAPWLARDGARPTPGALRRLWRPALGMMCLPVAQAASFQGTVAVIGAVLGSAAVPAFAAVRTLSRVAIQAILLVNHAVMPAMTAAAATGDRRRIAACARLSTLTSLTFGMPGALLLWLAGGRIVGWWTGGVLHPGDRLVAVMAAALAVNALWQPASNLLLATNRHERFAWTYLVAALAALGLCVPLTRWLGPAGAGGSLLLLDLAMLWRISRLSHALGLLNARDRARDQAGAASPA